MTREEEEAAAFAESVTSGTIEEPIPISRARAKKAARSDEDSADRETVNAAELTRILATHEFALVKDSSGRLYSVWRDAQYRHVEQAEKETFGVRATGLAALVCPTRLPGDAVLSRVFRRLAAQAQVVPIFHRVGYLPGAADRQEAIYLDLGDAERRCVEVTSAGWRVIPAATAPVLFDPSDDLLPLPEPVASSGGLQRYGANLALEGEVWQICVAFLVCSLMPPVTKNGHARGRGILVFAGEHQVGKTTRALGIVRLIDPRAGQAVALPTEPRDLAIQARARWVPLFDNHSGRMPHEMSDALCRLADGSGFSTRKLHTDDGQARFSGSRSVILTGIDATPTRGDLASRSWNVELPPILTGHRRTNEEILDECLLLAPAALAELLDAASVALRRQSEAYRPVTRLDAAERWLELASPAIGWATGDAKRLLYKYDRIAQRTSGESDRLTQELLSFMADCSRDVEYRGTSKRLLGDLEDHATKDNPRVPEWLPKTPESLSRAIQRCAPGLRALGCFYEKQKDPHTKNHVHVLCLNPNAEEELSHDV